MYIDDLVTSRGAAGVCSFSGTLSLRFSTPRNLERSESEARSFSLSDFELVRPMLCPGTSPGASQGLPGEVQRYMQTAMYLQQVMPPHFTSPSLSGCVSSTCICRFRCITQNLYWIHRRPLKAAAPSQCTLSANLKEDVACPDLEDTRPTAWAACRYTIGI